MTAINDTNSPAPLVSVVMITYNHEAFIAEAIEGVLMQKVDFPVEFIIADDSSRDRTVEIVQKYIKNHPNGHWILYTRHETNKGMMPNFIWALEEARGKYVALCEGDDYWNDPLKLKKQVDFLEANSNFSAYMHRLKIVNGYDIVAPKNYTCNLIKANNFFGILDVLSAKIDGTASIVFRSNIKHNLFENSSLYKLQTGDSLLFFHCALNGQIYFDIDAMGVYRRHKTGMTNNSGFNKWNYLNEYFKFLNFADKKTKYKYYNEINEIKLKKISRHNRLFNEKPLKFKFKTLYYHLCISLYVKFNLKVNKILRW